MQRGEWEYDGDNRYRLTSFEGSSQKYGPCEVCGKHCTEVFHQTHQVWVRGDSLDVQMGIKLDERGGFWTGYEAHLGGVGHPECLRSLRQTPHKAPQEVQP